MSKIPYYPSKELAKVIAVGVGPNLYVNYYEQSNSRAQGQEVSREDILAQYAELTNAKV